MPVTVSAIVAMRVMSSDINATTTSNMTAGIPRSSHAAALPVRPAARVTAAPRRRRVPRRSTSRSPQDDLGGFAGRAASRRRAELDAYRGLAGAHQWLAASLLVAFLSFVGVPPLAGFAAKLAVFAVAIDAGYAWLAVLAVVNSVISLAYYLRVLAPAYLEPPVLRSPSLVRRQALRS